MLSATCDGRVAPVMTVDTFGFDAHHAIASWASEHPRSPAMGTRLDVAGARAAGALGDALQVLTGEEPPCQRAVDRRAVTVVREQRRVLVLDPAAVQQAVLGLLGHRLAQMVALRDVDGVADLLHRPLGGSPIVGPTRLDDVRHRPNRLLHRRLRVGAVAESDVDGVEAVALERLVHRLHEELAVERAAGVDGVGQAPEELGGHQIGVAGPAQLGQRVPHGPLAFAETVRLGVVEVIDPGVPGQRHEFEGGVVVDLGGERRQRGAQRQDTDLHSGAAEASVLHCHGRSVIG